MIFPEPIPPVTAQSISAVVNSVPASITPVVTPSITLPAEFATLNPMSTGHLTAQVTKSQDLSPILAFGSSATEVGLGLVYPGYIE